MPRKNRVAPVVRMVQKRLPFVWSDGNPCDRCSMSPTEVIEPFDIRCDCWRDGAPQWPCTCGPGQTDAAA